MVPILAFCAPKEFEAGPPTADPTILIVPILEL
jgi:hypothetical protein